MKITLVLLYLIYASAQNISLDLVKDNINATVSGFKIPGIGRRIYAKPPVLSSESESQSKSSDEKSSSDDSAANHNNVDYDTAKIIADYNYPVEQYAVSTEDGYILQIQRIPSKNSIKSNTVLIFADFLASSLFWVITGPKYSLAFYLANLGYDVWLGNNRGGKYGQKHQTLRTNDDAFWYYSIHEWGIYDLPAIIDFIIDKNNCDKLSYIGWGHGADQFFVMASEKPEYITKIKNMQGFAPNAYSQNTRSRMKIAALNRDEDVFGSIYIVPNSVLFSKIGRDQCLKEAIKPSVCDYLEPLAHEGYKIDISDYPEITNDPPIQGSVRFLNHSVQAIKKGFRKFDNGPDSNLLYYGQKRPPRYNIKAADVPIGLYYSDDDTIADSKDVLHLSIDVTKLIRAFHIKRKHFGYIDFPLSKFGPECFFFWVAEVLERYNDF